MEQRTMYSSKTRQLANGTYDYVNSEGVLVRGEAGVSVQVTGQSDLANLPAYPVGTIAYTAGFTAMWQLDSDNEWVSMI